VELALHTLVDELADEPAGGGAHRSRSEQRRRGQTDRDAHGATQPMPLRPRWSLVCCTVTVPSSACVTRIALSILTFLSVTSSASPSKSLVAVSRSRYPPTKTSVGVSAIT
jgi:hypothetical protein